MTNSALLSLICLSVIQGITEWLPISSSGLLVIFEEAVMLEDKNKNLLLSEKNFFPLHKAENIFLREVIIFANGVPIMYARTVLPRKYLRGRG